MKGEAILVAGDEPPMRKYLSANQASDRGGVRRRVSAFAAQLRNRQQQWPGRKVPHGSGRACVWGRFPELIRQYKAPPACALTEEFYETDSRNDFVRGYALQTVAPLPIAMAHLLIEEDGDYGERIVERMQDYNHYATVGVLGEILPDERNFVSLHPTEKDRYGLPVAFSHFNLFDNDRRMMQAGISRARAVLEAAGATETHAVNRYAHLVGTCRIGSSATNSVVDRWCRSWDVPNLPVCDGSVLPTQGSANPAITISALAARTADWLRRAATAGELRARQRSKGEVHAA